MDENNKKESIVFNFYPYEVYVSCDTKIKTHPGKQMKQVTENTHSRQELHSYLAEQKTKTQEREKLQSTFQLQKSLNSFPPKKSPWATLSWSILRGELIFMTNCSKLNNRAP